MQASLARRTLLPPPFPEPLADEHLRSVAIAKSGFIVFAMLIDAGIWLTFRASPEIHRPALDAFAAINLPLLCLDLALTLGFSRRWTPMLRPVLLATIVLEMFTTVVWIHG